MGRAPAGFAAHNDPYTHSSVNPLYASWLISPRAETVSPATLQVIFTGSMIHMAESGSPLRKRTLAGRIDRISDAPVGHVLILDRGADPDVRILGQPSSLILPPRYPLTISEHNILGALSQTAADARFRHSSIVGQYPTAITQDLSLPSNTSAREQQNGFVEPRHCAAFPFHDSGLRRFASDVRRRTPCGPH